MRITIIAIALMTSGCLSTNWQRTEIAGDREALALKRDVYECKQESMAHFFGGIFGLMARRAAYNECMEVRGWKQ